MDILTRCRIQFRFAVWIPFLHLLLLTHHTRCHVWEARLLVSYLIQLPSWPPIRFHPCIPLPPGQSRESQIRQHPRGISQRRLFSTQKTHPMKPGLWNHRHNIARTRDRCLFMGSPGMLHPHRFNLRTPLDSVLPLHLGFRPIHASYRYWASPDLAIGMYSYFFFPSSFTPILLLFFNF